MKSLSLHTTDPLALRYLMTETIFGMDEPTVPGVAPRFSYYGGNKRNYLFLTHETRYEWMSESALEAFAKTLAALKLSVDDVAVLNVGKLPAVPAKSDLIAFFRPKVVVTLGAALPWDATDGLTVFEAHSFDEMLVDAEKKRLFWATIKTLLV